MNKFKFPIVVLTAVLFFSCVSQQIGLKENWIDERDVMALRDMPIEEWIEKAGLPTLVEIVGDTNLYYYNYRPTLYAVAIYDSTNFFVKAYGTASEQKPSLVNKAEVWGSRKDVMQIKVVKGLVLSAIVTEGPDKKVFIRDLNGSIVLDPNSGYNTSISEEQKVNSSFKEFSKIFSNLQGMQPAAAAPANEPAPAPAAEPAPAPAAEPAPAPAAVPAPAPAAEPAPAPAAVPAPAPAAVPAPAPAAVPAPAPAAVPAPAPAAVPAPAPAAVPATEPAPATAQ